VNGNSPPRSQFYCRSEGSHHSEIYNSGGSQKSKNESDTSPEGLDLPLIRPMVNLESLQQVLSVVNFEENTGDKHDIVETGI
jgi:hypothetical protein